MRMFIGILMVTAAATGGASTANAQSNILGQLLKRLQGPAATTNSAGRGAPVAIVAATTAQIDAIRKRLASAAVTPAIQQDLTAAGPLIETTIVTIACATEGTALRTLNSRRLTPKNYGTLDDTLIYTAMGGMRYHDRTTCVDLNRIGAVTKPALNALELTLNFVSASSGEGRVKTISFRRVGQEWLIDALGNADF